MARVIYLPQAKAHGFPVGLIGSMLRRHENLLKTLAFHDNEHGDASAQLQTTLNARVLNPINASLLRGGKRLQLRRLTISHDRHHTLHVQYQAGQETHSVTIALFEPSRKAQAIERAAEAAGESLEVSAPKRGVVKKRRLVPRTANGILRSAVSAP